MAADKDLYFQTITGFQQHVLRRWNGDLDAIYKLKPKMGLFTSYPGTNVYLTAWDKEYLTRKRTSVQSSGEATLAMNIEDGNPVFVSTVATYTENRETLDTLYGRDPQGLWIGGPFFKTKWSVKKELTPLRYGQAWTNPEYLRPPTTQNNASSFTAPVPSGIFADVGGRFSVIAPFRPTDLSWFIDRAYARVQAARNSSRPDRPRINSMLSIMELRDFPRLLRVAGENLLVQGASSFLSSKFGWEPIFRDLKNLFGITLAIDKQLKELKRLSGKPIRRKRTLFELNGTLETQEFNFPTGPSYRTVGPAEDTTANSVGVWNAKGTYVTYVKWHFPYDDIADIPPEIRNILKGVQLDYNTFWNIVPWTWLIDWVSNVGDFVEKEFQTKAVNLDIIDEWVMINLDMEHSLRVPTVHGSNMSASEGSPAGTATTTREIHVKWRGIPPESAPLALTDIFEFSGTQQAIIAALVASKDAKVVRR